MPTTIVPCADCREPSHGTWVEDMSSSRLALCDECAIDRDVRLDLYANQQRRQRRAELDAADRSPRRARQYSQRLSEIEP